MRRMLRALKSFWLVSLLLWAVGLAASVWWIRRTGGSPEQLGIAVAILTAVWLLAVVLRTYRKLRNERGLETLVQLEVDRESASVESSADFDILRERLKTALGVVKARGGRRHHLSELPWYLVVGLSASGKTSLLTRSGIDASVAAVAGEAGTQYCDWYFGSDAVMIDTAGRYIADEQPAREFADFLRLLARRRRRRPINGLLVVVDLPEILELPAEHNHALAEQLIERINTYYAALGATPPVYLCFSKFDLVPGFNETFHRLTEEERRQPWGMTFSVADIRGKGVKALFRRHLGAMVSTLRHRLERQLRVDAGADIDEAQRRFPDYLAGLESLLADFLEPFDLTVAGASAPLTRGIYFTSALQHQGEVLYPILDAKVRDSFALVAGDSAQSADVTAASDTPFARLRPRSYFIKGLLKDVVIADHNLVEHYSRKGRRRYASAWVTRLAMLAGVGLLGWLGYDYWGQQQGLLDLNRKIDGAIEQGASARLSLMHDELTKDSSAGSAAPAWWEADVFAVHRALEPSIEQTYFTLLQRQALERVADSLEEQLDAIGEMARAVGLDTRIGPEGAFGQLPSVGTSAPDADDGSVLDEGREAMADRRDSIRDRLTSQPSFGSMPHSPGELASRLRGEVDYRVRGSVSDAYWGVRQQGRDALREGARNAWRDGLNGLNDLVNSGPALGAGGSAISQVAVSRLTPDQVAQLIEGYDALKLYLVLTAPEQHPEADFVRVALYSAWRDLSKRVGGIAYSPAVIRDNVELYASYLEQRRAPALPRDDRLVAQARANLKAFLIDNTPADREYLRLRLAAQMQFPPLTLSAILPEDAEALMYATESVPAFFTQRVWREFVQPQLRETLSSELQQDRDWVLDSSAELDEDEARARFAEIFLHRYKQDYLFAWERFLASVGVRKFEGMDVSRQQLTRFSDYQRSPLKLLLQTVDANTRWDSKLPAQRLAAVDPTTAPALDGDSSGADPGQSADSPGVWKRTVDWISQDGSDPGARLEGLSELPTVHDGLLASYFSPVGQLFDDTPVDGGDTSQMDRYLLLLRQLKVRLDSIERGDAGKRTKQLVEEVIDDRPNEVSALRNFVSANIDTSEDELVQALLRLFRDPVTFSVDSLNGPMATYLAAAWGEQVATPWRSMVEGRFPVTDSANETSLHDLLTFVEPNTGLLAQFEQAEVGSLADAMQGDEPLVDPRITEMISVGTQVGDVLESLGDIENGFEIMIQPAPNLTSITLTVDGQEQVYRNGQQSWKRFTWPGEPRQAGVRLDVVTYSGMHLNVFDFPSRWGLLRMIESADVTNLDGARQRFTWYTGAGPVSFEARNFGGVKLTDLKKVRQLRVTTLGARG
ncbi:ImcF-like protein [Halomonas sp. DP8Y7-3]|uniref:type VI secretion protein IcmF/TssM N-terminal domain-containing protein n=1 Tax=Halomonas sp. DP8Y7-3 TaxID=2859079 RepID=UPI001C973564|nr:type VI secretion protein IcmF/TssM N-terminal domain-containing protein [Halomonas sp. DP8Y7-3]MBY5929706.1 ImcF-like protein [Halomonas sp. DP8Y7-3]